RDSVIACHSSVNLLRWPFEIPCLLTNSLGKYILVYLTDFLKSQPFHSHRSLLSNLEKRQGVAGKSTTLRHVASLTTETLACGHFHFPN
ncbi:hypothetical protein M5D96_001536, partial [Drosophila gunungcola]